MSPRTPTRVLHVLDHSLPIGVTKRAQVGELVRVRGQAVTEEGILAA